MNNNRRKKLLTSVELLNNAKGIIEDCFYEEQDSFDNLSEGLQATERGNDMEENMQMLEDIIEKIEEIDSDIKDIINK